MLLSLHCPLQLGSQEESHRAQQGRQSGYTRWTYLGSSQCLDPLPLSSPVAQGPPPPLCPVLETLRGTALNARCRVKELTLALGSEARGNLVQATWGGRKASLPKSGVPRGPYTGPQHPQSTVREMDKGVPLGQSH